ncbi:MAG: hypothetical protein PVF73_11475, partial [Bacteroidales bacterium]
MLLKPKITAFIVPIIFMMLFSSLSAQLSNGTLTTQEYFDLVISNLGNEASEVVDTVSPELNVVLPLEVFIVKDENGELNFDSEMLNANLDFVNGYFENIGLTFITGTVTEVPEYAYGTINDMEETTELETKYAKQDKINLFLVEEINLNNIPCYGYTFYPADTLRNVLFIRKDHVYGNCLSTLLGNYFGLLHTYDTIGEIEYVDGTNCNSSGDVICDTYADPGGLYDLVNGKCQYQGI